MEKDKAESRPVKVGDKLVLTAKVDNIKDGQVYIEGDFGGAWMNMEDAEAARPSVPQQGQLSSFQIAQFVNKLEKEYGRGAKIAITPNGLAAELWQALAASRSEEATPQKWEDLLKLIDLKGVAAEDVYDTDAEIKAAKEMCAEIISELESWAGAPAAGSTERAQAIKDCLAAVKHEMTYGSHISTQERMIIAVENLLAGTDTDVAKEPK